MRKFLKDVVSTLYASDGAMSLFRLTFAVAFLTLIGLVIADFCCPELTFSHYVELCGFTATLAGVACGNKLIKTGGGENE